MVPSPRPLSIVTLCSLLYSELARLHTGMEYMSFSEWLARRDEGFLLPDRPPRKGMARINPYPTTDSHRRRQNVRQNVKPPKKLKPFPPTLRQVAKVVPQKAVARLKQ